MKHLFNGNSSWVYMWPPGACISVASASPIHVHPTLQAYTCSKTILGPARSFATGGIKIHSLHYMKISLQPWMAIMQVQLLLYMYSYKKDWLGCNNFTIGMVTTIFLGWNNHCFLSCYNHTFGYNNHVTTKKLVVATQAWLLPC